MRFADALSMADAVMTYKLVVKEIAMKHGVYASFMPKPMADAPGSGMHVHQSLVRSLDGNNVFFDPDDPSGLQPVGHGEELHRGPSEVRAGVRAGRQPVRELLQAPASRAGRRPPASAWGARKPLDARCASRAIARTARSACRVELRSPDPAANPYLAFAVMLAAGLAGIEEGLELMPPRRSRTATCSAAPAHELHRARGIEHAAGNPWRGRGAASRRAKLMRETLGRAHPRLPGAKPSSAEWDEYQSSVSTWELDRYLAVL